MAKKKATADEAVGPPAEQRPTRELWRFVDYYNKNIKAHSREDCMGVIKNMQRLIDKGLGVEDFAIALENYQNDEWRKANPAYSKSIRSFFTMECIKEWLKPRPKMVKPDPLAHVHRFEPTVCPKPAVVAADLEDDSSPEDL